jgi:2-polyprenyl-3-methyl-5-hydroxy-6-metoxy-1,4-benzoquinol methylase
MNTVITNPCPACGNESVKPIKTKLSHQLYCCDGCEFYFCHPLPAVDSASANENSVLTEENFTKATIDSWSLRKNIFVAAAQKRHDFFTATLGRPQYSVLEIGCGIAGFGDEFQRLGLDYTGIDIDSRMVERAKNRGLNVNQEDLFNLPLNHKFDVITFSQVLEHIKDPSAFIERVQMLLTPNGIVECDVPNHNSLAGAISKILSKDSNRFGGIDLPHHAFSYTAKSLRQLFEKHFQVTDLLTVNPLHPTWGQAVPQSLKNNIYYTSSDILGLQSLLVIVCTQKSLAAIQANS